MKSLKTKVHEWIISSNIQEKVIIDNWYFFMLEGFADEPEVYVRTFEEGLEFGYEGTQWLDGHTPAPYFYKKHTLTWDDLQPLSKEDQQQMILDLLMKTVNSRKRQYRKCQFCGEKVPVEHRYDNATCHSCSSKYFGVVF